MHCKRNGGLSENKMVMWQYYIQAPYTFQPITILKGGVVVEKLDPNSVPADYRRDRMKKFKDWLFYAKRDIKNFFQRRNGYGKEKY